MRPAGRECLAIEVASSIDALRVIAVLERLSAPHGTPAALRSDNGPEFIARALKIWARMHHTDLATIEPGKPWQISESLNGTLRAECLDPAQRATDLVWFPDHLDHPTEL